MNFPHLSELASLSESTSTLETLIKELCKKRGAGSPRKLQNEDGVLFVELAGDNDYEEIGNVIDDLEAKGYEIHNKKWRRAMGMGYVSFQMDAEPLKEGLLTEDLGELLDKYIDQNKMYHFEGPSGVQKFAKIVGVLGYSSVDAFLEDNSGAIDAMIQWIGEMSEPEWRAALAAEVGEHEHAPEENPDPVDEALREGADIEGAMKSQYNFKKDGEDEHVHIKDDHDFPYRIRKKGEGVTLSQAYSARVHMKPSYNKIGDFASRDEALARIVKKHNKSTGHMTSWKKIEV